MKKYILLLAFTCTWTFSDAQKNVLFEKFTNAFCGVCPDATLLLEDIVNANTNVIWISHHKPVTWTVNPLTNERSIAIWDELNVAGVPNGMVDRTMYNGNITMSSSLWAERINNHQSQPEEFDLTIGNVQFDDTSRELTFSVGTQALVQVPSDSYRITAYIVEDSVTGTQQHSYFNETAGHPLEGLGEIMWSYHHRNVVRTILEDHWGTPNIIPNDPNIGTTYTHDYSYIVPAEYNAEKMKIVAMVSSFNESNNYPGEVKNATQLILSDLGIKLTSSKELLKDNVSISPNPTSDFVHILSQEVPDEIMIFDMKGELKTQIMPSGKQSKVDLSSFISSNYFVVIRRNGKSIGQIITLIH